MSHSHAHHNHDHRHDRQVHKERADVSDTLDIQRAYSTALTSPLGAIADQIEEDVGERDVLDLGSTQRFDPEDMPQFDFPTNEQKREAFLDWLERQEQAGVLSVISPDENEYIDEAYVQGMSNADLWVEDAGGEVPDVGLATAFDMPIHQRKIESLYTRNFENLEDITTDMADEISEQLSQGLVDGINPRDMAANITDRVDKVGMTRAETLARTEVMHAHSEASLTRYEQNSAVNKVDILTSNPCELCEAIAADGPYGLSEARGIIPAHPRCICAWAPRVN